jgi:hypothetical protein
MDYYKFLGIFLKVHYVKTIQKLSMKFIQCDYIIYNHYNVESFFILVDYI